VDALGMIPPRRRYYGLTRFGRSVVKAEAARFVALASSRRIRSLAEEHISMPRSILGQNDGSGPMVMTILEAQVPSERWDALRASYETRARLPESGAIVESFLVQGAEEASTWRIVTVWRDREALDAMRGSGETPTGVLIFRDAGAEPRLTIFTVWANPQARSRR
jgi:hypothetical protein